MESVVENSNCNCKCCKSREFELGDDDKQMNFQHVKTNIYDSMNIVGMQTVLVWLFAVSIIISGKALNASKCNKTSSAFKPSYSTDKVFCASLSATELITRTNVLWCGWALCSKVELVNRLRSVKDTFGLVVRNMTSLSLWKKFLLSEHQN